MKKLFSILMAGLMTFAMIGGSALAEPQSDTLSPDGETPVVVTEAPVETIMEAPETEAPATEVPATEVPATEVPATEVPVTEAPMTEAPATEDPATEAPATEVPAPALSAKYAVIAKDAKVYAERTLETLLGEFPSEQLVYVSYVWGDLQDDVWNDIVEIRFDTEDTKSEKDPVTAYFRVKSEDDLKYLTVDEAAAETAKMASVRTYNGDKLPVTEFKPVEKATEAPTEEPTEAPTEEPTEAPTEVPTEEPSPLPTEALEPVETPEVTEVPTEAPAEEPADVPVDEEKTLAERVEESNPERDIALNVAWDVEVPVIGANVTLTMEVTGYDGLIYTVFWECDKGEDWETVSEGETSITFEVTEENVNWQWRPCVEITAVAEAPAEETPAAETAETEAAETEVPATEAPAEEPVA